jgi:pimeloyl-ACP methyl ester carboxylesterase
MPYATNDGVRIYYEREGSGPALILHAGFLQRLQHWQDFAGYVDALKNDYSLILIDPRGHGGTDKPHDPALHTYDRRVADVLAVMDNAGIAEAIFWGYSMGGRVGYAIADYVPERFRAFVIGGMHPYAPTPENTSETQLLRGGMASFVAVVEQNLGPLPQAMRDDLLSQDAEALVASSLATAEAPSFAAALARLEVPMLVYVGAQDEGYHDLAQRAAAGQERVTFVSLPDLNHLEAFSRSDIVLPHVRAFLAGVDAR